jgi:hypothetical protein
MLRDFTVNNGKDRAHLVYEKGPGGYDALHVTHQRVLTERMTERLFDRGKINTDQKDAANKLRDDYERGVPKVGSLAAQDPSVPYVSGGRGDGLSLGDDEAFGRYNRAMLQLGRDWRGVVHFIVIGEGTPEAYGARTRSEGLAMLQTALDVLVRHYGLVAKRRRAEDVAENRC